MTDQSSGMGFADGCALILGIAIAVIVILACIGKYARRLNGGLLVSNASNDQ